MANNYAKKLNRFFFSKKTIRDIGIIIAASDRPN